MGDSIATPDRSDQFATFIDTAVAITAGAPGFSQWWSRFKGALQAMVPSYVDRIDQIAQSPDTPDLLEFMPWFVPDESKSADV